MRTFATVVVMLAGLSLSAVTLAAPTHAKAATKAGTHVTKSSHHKHTHHARHAHHASKAVSKKHK